MADNSIPIEWRPCKGFPSYEVSNRGDVRRAVPAAQGQKGRPAGFVLKPKVVWSGHHFLNLYVDGSHRSVRVHRLVAEAFLPPKPGPEYVCCHNNGDPKDNRAVNLRWDTQRGNLADTIAHGTRCRGTTHGMVKLTLAQVQSLRARRAAGERCSALARELGISHATVSLLTRGRTWAHVP